MGRTMNEIRLRQGYGVTGPPSSRARGTSAYVQLRRDKTAGRVFTAIVASVDFRATFCVATQMEQNPPPPFPSPEELKAKITEFMKQNFGDRVSVATVSVQTPNTPVEDETTEKTEHP